MGEKYELQRVDEEVWRKTREEIRVKMYRFTELKNLIIKNNKSIERLTKKIKKLKSDKREWLKEKNKLRSEDLYAYQYNYHPSVSPTQQSTKNYQWSINLNIGGVKRKKYLGSDSKVRKHLDELKDVSTYSSLGEKLHSMDGHEQVKIELKKIIEKNISQELDKDFDGFNEKWKNNELRMWDYLRKPEKLDKD